MSRLSPQRIGALAVEALILEVSLAPKPGLVTPLSAGAHADMDHGLLLASAQSLRPCFEACAAAGSEAAAQRTEFQVLLRHLKAIGLEGERTMYRATGGVNAHKGAIFCLGLLSASLAHLLAGTEVPVPLGDAACRLAGRLCEGLVGRELVRREGPRTAGERLYLEHGVRGARGQAEAGYPVLRERLLPHLRSACSPGSDRFSRACLEALLLSMRELEDSCLLSRGGLAGLEVVRQGADRVLSLGGPGTALGLEALLELDLRLCHARLSPGGSADLLAGGIFLARAERAVGAHGRTTGAHDRRSAA